MAQRHPNHIDLLVTDVVLTGMNGKTASEKLIALRPNQKVIFISGHTPDGIVQRGVLDHGAEFLQKPFRPSALAEKVRQVLDR